MKKRTVIQIGLEEREVHESEVRLLQVQIGNSNIGENFKQLADSLLSYFCANVLK